MNSRKKTKAMIVLLTRQLSNQQSQVQNHKLYLKKEILPYGIISGLILCVCGLSALKYPKARRFFSIFFQTVISTAPRLLIKNSKSVSVFPVALIQALATAGFNVLTNRIKKG